MKHTKYTVYIINTLCIKNPNIKKQHTKQASFYLPKNNSPHHHGPTENELSQEEVNPGKDLDMVGPLVKGPVLQRPVFAMFFRCFGVVFSLLWGLRAD